MQKTTRRLFSMLLALAMVLGMLPMTAVPAFAEGKIVISSVTATSNIAAPVYGDTLKWPTFTVTAGDPAHIESGNWRKKIGEKWVQINSPNTITEGEWRYYTQLRIDGVSGTTHVLSEEVAVMVNGAAWEKGIFRAEDTYSYIPIYSPVYTVTAPEDAPLTFTDLGFSIPENNTSAEITPLNVSGAFSGGTKPYTFSKASGPAWIQVSTDGIISGTPDAVGPNADLVVRATDSSASAQYKEITIAVGSTSMHPADRTVVDAVEATVTGLLPVYGAALPSPDFTVTAGDPAHFEESGSWRKKIDENWVQINSPETITEGEWRYHRQVCIDGVSGTTHVLSEEVTVMVDGAAWEKGDFHAYDTYSYIIIYSPVYTVTDSATLPDAPTDVTAVAGDGQATVSFTAPASNGGAAITGYTVTSNPGGVTATGTGSPITVTGLTNGTAYTFTVAATNSKGNSAASAASAAVTPAAVTTYTVTFDANGGTNTMAPQAFTEGVAQTLTANTFTRDGHTFAGWATTAGGAVAYSDAANVTMTATITLYAKWTPDTPDTYTVTISGGGSGADGAGGYEEGEPVTIKAGNKSGYTFTGWTSSDVTITDASKKTATFTMPDHDVAVTANWTRISGGGSGGGSTTTTPPATSTAPEWLEKGKTSASINEAKEKGHSYTLTRANGRYGVRASAWAAFTGFQYWHDTMYGNAVQVRVYVKNPAAITTDLLLSGTVKGPEVEAIKALFERFFSNKVRTIHLDQAEAWGQPVGIAAKVDLADMDITKLMIYSYDKAANTYRRIEKPAYWLDANGYLHFTTSLAGDIVISEGALALRNAAK